MKSNTLKWNVIHQSKCNQRNMIFALYEALSSLMRRLILINDFKLQDGVIASLLGKKHFSNNALKFT